LKWEQDTRSEDAAAVKERGFEDAVERKRPADDLPGAVGLTAWSSSHAPIAKVDEPAPRYFDQRIN